LEGRVELTVEHLPDGEVSPYLTQQVAVGDRLELRGPIGGWFVWRPRQTEPIQLIGGGSGIVPLMAMIRSRASAASTAPFRLLYSVRKPGAVFYRNELQAISDHGNSVTLSPILQTPGRAQRKSAASRPVKGNGSKRK
jgi:ferredoxin-NADP reductase